MVALAQECQVAKAQVSRYRVPVSHLLKRIIEAMEAGGQTRYRIAQGSGVAQSQLSRLVRGEGGMSVANIERIAEYLGLEVVLRPKRKTRRR